MKMNGLHLKYNSRIHLEIGINKTSSNTACLFWTPLSFILSKHYF